MKKLLLPLCFVTTIAHAEDNFLFYKQWEIICDNTRTCRAAGIAGGDDDNPSLLLLTRQAGQGQRIAADMKRAEDIDGVELRDLPNTGELFINDKYAGPLHFNDDDKTRLTPHQTQSVLKALTGNLHIRIRSGQYTSTISGEGSRAVLLKMDAIQGRVGTTSAVIRRGTKTDVLPALPAPVIVRKPMYSLDVSKWNSVIDVAALKKEIEAKVGDNCIFDNEEGDEVLPKVVAQLTPDALLVSATCIPSPNHPAIGLWRINTQAPYKPEAIMLDASGFFQSDIVADYFVQGYGDCATHRQWAWTGKAFELIADYDTGVCTLTRASGPWQMPTFVSKVE